MWITHPHSPFTRIVSSLQVLFLPPPSTACAVFSLRASCFSYCILRHVYQSYPAAELTPNNRILAPFEIDGGTYICTCPAMSKHRIQRKDDSLQVRWTWVYFSLSNRRLVGEDNHNSSLGKVVWEWSYEFHWALVHLVGHVDRPSLV